MAAPRPSSPPTAQLPPDLPFMPDVSNTLSQYLRTFALWCRHGFADKLSATAASPGLLLQAYDAPSGTLPATYMLEVSSAGTAALAPVLAGGALPPASPGAPVPIGTVGTSTNDSAPAGSIGEVISSVVVVASQITLSTGVVANVTTISLTAGDWDVSGNVSIVVGTGGATFIGAGISATSVTLPGGAAGINQSRNTITAAIAASNTASLPLNVCRISLAATTTYYLVVVATFPSGTTTAYGAIWARRAR